MPERLAESNKPGKSLPETSLQLFEQRIRTLSPRDFQGEWVKFLKERGFDSIYTQPGKELSVHFSLSLLYQGTYGYDKKSTEQTPPELKALLDFFMGPKIKPETREKMRLFGKELLRRQIYHESKEKINGVDKLLTHEAYKGLSATPRDLIKMFPGNLQYKIRLAKEFEQLNKDFKGKNISSCLKTLYEIESIFLKTNEEYNQPKIKQGGYRLLTEAFILGARQSILRFSPSPSDGDIIKSGYFFSPGDGTRILKRIDRTRPYTLDKNNGLYRLFEGIVDIPDTYTIHYFKENNSQLAGMHYVESGDIFINEFGLWRKAQKDTFSNEILHNLVRNKMRGGEWDKIDFSGAFEKMGWKKDSNFPPIEVNEFLSDVASVNEDISAFYEFFQDANSDGYGHSWEHKNYELSHMHFLRIIKEVLGEKRDKEIRDVLTGRSKEKVRLTKEEEKKVQEAYLNIGRGVLSEIVEQIKKLPPSVPLNTNSVSQ